MYDPKDPCVANKCCNSKGGWSSVQKNVNITKTDRKCTGTNKTIVSDNVTIVTCETHCAKKCQGK